MTPPFAGGPGRRYVKDMGRDRQHVGQVQPQQVEAYLQRRGYADAKLISLQPLGGDTQGGVKAYGYGRPLLVTFAAAGRQERLVLRTMSPDPFSHDQRADRAYQMILCRDSFNTIPQHIHALDAGAFDGEGALISAGDGEWFLLTDYVDGELYAGDLGRIAAADQAAALDCQRAGALATFLADLHSRPADRVHYLRHIRDTVGTGEGIFGQSDSYPPEDPVAPPARLQAIERRAIAWRWKLRAFAHRACVTHGDFHPFNLLFRQGSDFSVLDCSRGGMGEAADDVTCLSVNYLFFALRGRGRFDGALRQVWEIFWRTYLAASKDKEVLAMVPIYFTWRALVLASPVWYPQLDVGIREALLSFSERLLDGAPFVPDQVDALLP